MRENKPGKDEWTAEELARKNTSNITKLRALTILKRYYGDGLYFGSEDLAAEMDITRKYSAIILNRLRKAGVIRVVQESVMTGEKGRSPIVYAGTPELTVKLEHVLHRTHQPVKVSSGRTVPHLEV